ncbi:hypothetical protein ACFFUB_14220 [Algimonas porphyrae]|uniref:Uncharacterized protein n=1 Tax=Algimonas porphyrae TaxID=1128113 RepID=A0ABQ5UWL4_9PROT|nr:hypothetical protein [Algimonas porphyrae]GLQ19576.1 hypothetical protein GCM10007854_05310 [Algimonas porphyrae]
MDRKWTFILYGIVFWLLGVVMIRVLHPYFYGDLGMHVLFLLIAIAIAPPTLLITARLSGRTKHEMVVPTALMAMPAMLMDGLSVTLDAMGITHIYADNPLHSAYAGGVLLVAFWATLMFALLWHRQPG